MRAVSPPAAAATQAARGRRQHEELSEQQVTQRPPVRPIQRASQSRVFLPRLASRGGTHPPQLTTTAASASAAPGLQVDAAEGTTGATAALPDRLKAGSVAVGLEAHAAGTTAAAAAAAAAMQSAVGGQPSPQRRIGCARPPTRRKWLPAPHPPPPLRLSCAQAGSPYGGWSRCRRSHRRSRHRRRRPSRRPCRCHPVRHPSSPCHSARL